MAYLILPSPWRQQPQQAVLVSSEARSAGLVSAPLWSQGFGRVHDPAFPAQQFVNVGGALRPGLNGVGLSLVAASSQYLKSATIPLNPKNGFTALALVKPASSAPAATNTFLGFGNAADASSIVYGFQFATSGHLGIQFRDSASLGPLITTSQQMLAGNWYPIAVRSNGTNSTAVRINGTTYTDTTAIGTFTTPDNYTIGGLYRTSIVFPFDGEMHGPWLFNTALTDNQIDGWLANIWLAYQAPPRRIYVNLPAGGTTIALTGQATTASQGSLGVSVSAALAGQTTAAAQGTLTPTVGIVVPLTGQATTEAQGQLSVAVDTALAGQATNATQGSLAVAVAVPVAGQSVTGSQGALGVSIAVPLLGQVTAVAQGSVGIGGNIVIALAGQSTLTQQGVLTPVGGNVAARGPLTDGDERKKKRPHRQQVREALIEAFEGPYREEAKEIAAKHVPFAEVSIDTVQLDKFARDLEAVERMMALVEKQRDEEDEDILLMMIQ